MLGPWGSPLTAPVTSGAGSINLQSTLSASSAGTEAVNPHHPITCADALEYDLDGGEFRCPHVSVALTEERTVRCVQHSIALLLIELAVRAYG